jgi:hypothetical protein
VALPPAPSLQSPSQARRRRAAQALARRTPDLLRCTELGKVAELMVKTSMSNYKLVYRLIELILILSVATASVERIFSAMSIIKTDLRSNMGDEWLNDLMICYCEKEIFRLIDIEKIKKRFQEMKPCRMQLPRKVMVCYVLF